MSGALGLGYRFIKTFRRMAMDFSQHYAGSANTINKTIDIPIKTMQYT